MKNKEIALLSVLICAAFLIPSMSVISVTDESDGDTYSSYGDKVRYVYTPGDLISSLKDQTAHTTVVMTSMELTSSNVVIVNGNEQLIIGGWADDVYNSVDLSIEHGTQFNINTGGRVTVCAGSSLTNHGTIINNSGKLKESGSESEPKVALMDSSSGSNNYDYTNYGMKVEGSEYIHDLEKNVEAGTIYNYGGEIRNYGFMYFAGDAEMVGGFYNYGAIVHSGNFNIYNKFLNKGTVIVEDPKGSDDDVVMKIDIGAVVINDGSNAEITVLDSNGKICMKVGDAAHISSATISVESVDARGQADIVLKDTSSVFGTGNGYVLSNVALTAAGTGNSVKMVNLIAANDFITASFGSLHISGSYEGSDGSITVTEGAVNVSGTLSSGTTLTANAGTEIKIDPEGLILQAGSNISVGAGATVPAGLPTGTITASDAGAYKVNASGVIVPGLVVTFNAMGGTTDVTSVVAINGERYGDSFTSGKMPDATKDNMDFRGWYTGTDGTGVRITANTVVDLSGDITLYAYYTVSDIPEKVTTASSYDPNIGVMAAFAVLVLSMFSLAWVISKK